MSDSLSFPEKYCVCATLTDQDHWTPDPFSSAMFLPGTEVFVGFSYSSRLHVIGPHGQGGHMVNGVVPGHALTHCYTRPIEDAKEADALEAQGTVILDTPEAAGLLLKKLRKLAQASQPVIYTDNVIQGPWGSYAALRRSS